MNIRNRIKEHRRVRAGDLLPHELNWRIHPQKQQQALRALLQEVGFARSLLAFETADGKLKLIDGHLRRDLHPDLLVDVEILDVDEEEARKLLLSLDPLAGLAESDGGLLDDLAKITETDSKVLQEMWNNLKHGDETVLREPPDVKEQFLILVECQSESDQVALLQRFQQEGFTCRALLA